MTMKITPLKKYIGAFLVMVALSTCAGAWWGYAHLTSLVQARLKVSWQR